MFSIPQTEEEEIHWPEGKARLRIKIKYILLTGKILKNNNSLSRSGCTNQGWILLVLLRMVVYTIREFV